MLHRSEQKWQGSLEEDSDLVIFDSSLERVTWADLEEGLK